MNERFPPGKPFIPPDEPHSPYYPARGLYSSRDESVLREQMREIAAAGIDSVMLSTTGPVGTRSAVAYMWRGRATCAVVPSVACRVVDGVHHSGPVQRHAAPM